MPLYDYHCKRCGETFEVRQKFADETLVTHEGCGGEVERLISAPALQFKGSGWYITDYARGGKGGQDSGKSDASKSDSSGSSKSESKTESKTESKSDSKTESKPSPAKSGKE
jgi:putative FmdB family regulatory protein